MNGKLYMYWSKFLTVFGKVMISIQPPTVKAWHIRELMKCAEPGDIILRKFDCYADSYFIKGMYSHSGVVVSKETVVHAVAEGVGSIDIIDFVKDCDGFILVRPRWANLKSGSWSDMITYAKSQIGKPYDFMFDTANHERFYCHELSAMSLKSIGLDVFPVNGIVYAKDIISYCDIIFYGG